MTYEEFGQRVKEAYPEYKNLPDEELAVRVIEKYPVYKSRISVPERASRAVASVYEGYKNLPGVKQAGQAVGAAVGTAGALIGGTVGAIGETGIQMFRGATGKKVDLGKIVRSAYETAKSTGQFGFEIGREGAAAAPIGAAGKLVTVPLAGSQIYEGQKNVRRGLETGDTARAVEGGLQLGTGLLAGRTAFKEKGLLLTRPAQETLIPGLKEKRATKALAKAEEKMAQVLNTGKAQLRAQQQADLYGRVKRNPERTALEEKVVLERDATGGLDTTPAIKTNLMPKADQIHKDVISLLQNETPRHNLRSIISSAVKDVNNRKALAASERKSMISELMKIGDDEMEHYGRMRLQQKGVPETQINKVKPEQLRKIGENLTDQELEFFKEGMWNMGFDQSRPVKNASEIRMLGSRARDILIKSNKDKKTVDGKTVEDLLMRESEIRNLINVLEKSHGTKVRGGLLGKRINQATAAIAGLAVSGIPGAMIGSELAGRATDLMLNPTTRSQAAIRQYERSRQPFTPGSVESILRGAASSRQQDIR